jgi:hypothetical protein
MAAKADFSIKSALPECVNEAYEGGKYTLVFKTESAAAAFDGFFAGLVKTDKLMKTHCQLLLPHGPKSQDPSGYALTTSWIAVKFDEAFTCDMLKAKIAAIYRPKV